MTQLYKRDDARRMLRTCANIRKEQGESVPSTVTANIRRMQALPANMLIQHFNRPSAYRGNAVLESVTGKRVTFTVNRVTPIA